MNWRDLPDLTARVWRTSELDRAIELEARIFEWVTGRPDMTDLLRITVLEAICERRVINDMYWDGTRFRVDDSATERWIGEIGGWRHESKGGKVRLGDTSGKLFEWEFED